jgi:hypothetical protein
MTPLRCSHTHRRRKCACYKKTIIDEECVMLVDGSNAIENNGSPNAHWQRVHSAIVSIAKRRAALDAEEAEWLREAERIQIWKQLGMVSMLDYMEREVHYAPRTAHDRLRVARALADLPALSESLSSGELSYSAIREVVRVATPRTESAWLDAAHGRTLREIESMVAGHRPGDLPDDPPDDQARLHRVTYEEVDAATYALARQARQLLDDEHATRMTDSQVLAAMCSAIIDGTSPSEHGGRARNQIGYIVCRACDRASQEGAGVRVPVDKPTLAQARCDAQHIGDLDSNEPQRATQDIPPSTVRHIWRRDGGRCQTPGCRSARGLEIHHIVARSRGGSHDPSNLTLRCGACHRAHHTGLITISGTAPNALSITRKSDRVTTQGVSPVPLRPTGVTNSPIDRATNTIDRTTSRVDRATNAIDRTTGRVDRATNAIDRATSPVDRATNAIDRATSHVDRANGPVELSVCASISTRYQAALTRTDLIAALTASGWTKHIAMRAVDDACAHVGTNVPFDALLREAFRRCPKP